MNKRIFLIYGSLFFLLSVLISMESNNWVASRLSDVVQKIFSEKTESYLQYLGSNVRNDLLLGNIRGARNSLTKARDNNLYSHFSIIQGPDIVDTTISFDTNLENFMVRDIPIQFNEQGNPWGKIRFYIDQNSLKKQVSILEKDLKLFAFLNVFLIIATIAVFYIFLLRSSDFFALLFEKAVHQQALSLNGYIGRFWMRLFVSVQNIVAEKVRIQAKLDKANIDIAVAAISKQVAHDIRSPISALNMAVSNFDGLTEEQKKIIKQVSTRINDIADELLINTKKQDETSRLEFDVFKDKTSSCLLLPALTTIIQQKQLEFQNNQIINITLRTSHLPDNIKIRFPEKTLQRILSNLINNSVEAILEDGSIFIEAFVHGSNVSITVVDFGKGIPDEVLHRLQNNDFVSYGKGNSPTSGSAIGLPSAYAEITRAGGKFKIDSKISIGTKVDLEIPID